MKQKLGQKAVLALLLAGMLAPGAYAVSNPTAAAESDGVVCVQTTEQNKIKTWQLDGTHNTKNGIMVDSLSAAMVIPDSGVNTTQLYRQVKTKSGTEYRKVDEYQENGEQHTIGLLDSSVKNGHWYRYRAAFVYPDGHMMFSKPIRGYYLSQAKITKVSSKTRGKATVSWKKNSKANSYVVIASTTPNWNGAVKKITVSGKKTSVVVSGLKAGKKHYFFVRSRKHTKEHNYLSAKSEAYSLRVRK